MQASAMISAVWEKGPEQAKAVIVVLHGRTWSTLPDFDLQVEGEELSLMDGLIERGYRTYGLDQRGYGATPRDQSGWLTPDQAAVDFARALEWIRAQNPQIPVHVFGWSLGSMVAQLTAQRSPAAIDRLALFGYPNRPGASRPLDEPDGPPARAATTAQGAASDFIVPGSISEGAVEEYVRASLEADPVRVDWRFQHQWNALDGAEVTQPTLIIHGEHDPLAPLEAQGALFQSLGNADKAWVVVPGGDHAAFLETPRPYMLKILDAFFDPGLDP
jgi:pimeloyl-ACP methyl ester carboxylesterase